VRDNVGQTGVSAPGCGGPGWGGHAGAAPTVWGCLSGGIHHEALHALARRRAPRARRAAHSRREPEAPPLAAMGGSAGRHAGTAGDRQRQMAVHRRQRRHAGGQPGERSLGRAVLPVHGEGGPPERRRVPAGLAGVSVDREPGAGLHRGGRRPVLGPGREQAGPTVPAPVHPAHRQKGSDQRADQDADPPAGGFRRRTTCAASPRSTR